jgi:hypothetical protein
MSKQRENYVYQTIGMGGAVLEARFYSFEELKQILKAQEILDRHLEKAMRDTSDD